jgi:hypothetical protein
MARRQSSRRRAAPAVKPEAATAPVAFHERLARTVRRRKYLIVGALVVSHLVLAWLSFMPVPHPGGDNAAYLALARSLIERHAYVELYDPLEPPHTQYPPVFPGILALAILLGFGSWVHFKVIITFFSAIAIAFTFLWILRRRRPLLALGTGALLVLSPGVLELSHWELSDVPFWAFTAVALWAWERLGPRDHKRLAVAIAATTLAYFTRSAGLPLILAAFLWLILRKRWTQLLATAAVIAPLAFLWWLRSQAQGGVDYVDQFWLVDPYSPEAGRLDAAGMLARAGQNIVNYARAHLPFLLAGPAVTPFSVAASLFVILFAVFGWLRRVRRPGVAELLLPPYLALLFLWPAVWSGERFLLPVFALLLVYAGDAVVRISRRLMPRRPVLVPSFAVALLLLIALFDLPGHIRAYTRCRVERAAGDQFACLSDGARDALGSAVWARDHLPRDAVVIARKPRLFWAFSDLKSIIFPFSPEPAELFAAAERVRARFLLFEPLDRQTYMYLRPVVMQKRQAFCLMRVSDITTTLVLGILPNAGTMPDTPSDSMPDVPFDVCPADYWRNPADRDLLLRLFEVR